MNHREDVTKPLEMSQETESLVKRLAGPSVTKAGLALDQTEINRVIAEASKGSKFYDNEKKKDKDVTEKINRILKQRDEVLSSCRDVLQVEKNVEQLLVELEEQRDLTQFIVHIDMDAFFANVELLHQPDLLGKPFGVGRGVLTTASYEARKYGVRSGMPGFIAKKLCPDLIFVPMNFERYNENSKLVMDIFRRYDPNLHIAGCDEAYLNITPYCQEHGIGPEACVQEMRAKVKEETDLTASAGIAPNKMLAKICSDTNKPNGQFFLPFDRKVIVTFMKDLSIRKIQGVGRVNERLLDAIGIKNCGDIWTHRVTLSLMDKQFGVQFLLRTYLGIASNVVQPGQREERKSVGSERTFRDLSDKDKILAKLEEIALELEGDLKRLGFTGRTVTLKYKLDTYQVFSRAKSYSRWISGSKEDLFVAGKELLLPELPLTLRLIGLRVTKLKDLRAASPGGIKRFFEAVDTSPHKKRRISGDDEVINIDTDDPPLVEIENETLVDAMPGYYEHDHEDNIVDMDVDADDGSDLDKEPQEGQTSPASGPRPRPRPPVSAPARIASASTSGPSASVTSSKPHSTHQIPTRATSSFSRIPDAKVTAVADSSSHITKTKRKMGGNDPELGWLTCPICAKTLQMDNQGLNAHIDFCLSRGAIMDAQTKADSPAKPRIQKANSKEKKRRNG